jgi:hypothetical protein
MTELILSQMPVIRTTLTKPPRHLATRSLGGVPALSQSSAFVVVAPSKAITSHRVQPSPLAWLSHA